MQIVKTSITEKLVTYFLLLNITAILLVGVLSYINSRDALNRRTFDQLTSLKVVKKRQIENFFRERINEANFFARSVLSRGGKLSDAASNSLFSNFLSDFRFYKRIIILSPGKESLQFFYSDGILNSEKFRADNNFTEKALAVSNSGSNSSIFEFTEGYNKDFSLFISKKICGSDDCSLLIFEIETDKINSIMYETNPEEGLGKTGESYIIDDNYVMRTKSRFLKNSATGTIVKTQGASNAVTGQDGTLIYRDYRNIEVLGSYVKLNLPDINWYILAEIDLDEANQPILKMRNNIFILTLLIAALDFVITYLLSKKITIPIVRLTEAAKGIVKGKYTEIEEPKTNDEIGILTATFNNLAKTLQDQEITIEKERQKRSQAAIEAMETERQRLSRELHDGLGQNLISHKLMLENINISQPEKAAQILSDVKDSIDSTINEVRHISNDLMPSVLFQFGLVNAVRMLCNDLNEFSGLNITFTSDSIPDNLSDRIKIYLFRIAQEGLKNSIKHSKGSRCGVKLFKEEDRIKLIINDDGIGFSPNNILEGNGLINIRERVNLLGGSLIINSDKKTGTELLINIPMVNNE